MEHRGKNPRSTGTGQVAPEFIAILNVFNDLCSGFDRESVVPLSPRTGCNIALLTNNGLDNHVVLTIDEACNKYIITVEPELAIDVVGEPARDVTFIVYGKTDFELTRCIDIHEFVNSSREIAEKSHVGASLNYKEEKKNDMPTLRVYVENVPREEVRPTIEDVYVALKNIKEKNQTSNPIQA